MPSDVERQNSERDALLDRGRRKVKRLWDGFVDFAFEGNVLQIAFGLMSALSVCMGTRTPADSLLVWHPSSPI